MNWQRLLMQRYKPVRYNKIKIGEGPNQELLSILISKGDSVTISLRYFRPLLQILHSRRRLAFLRLFSVLPYLFPSAEALP